MTPAPKPTPEMPRPLTDEELVAAKRKRIPLALAMLVAIGSFFGKFFVWDVLEAARNGAERVNYSLKAVFLTGLIPGAIVVVLWSWRFAPNLDERMRTMPWLRYAVAAAIALPGLAFVYWFRTELSKLGYAGR